MPVKQIAYIITILRHKRNIFVLRAFGQVLTMI
jgi:hypothetical protein